MTLFIDNTGTPDVVASNLFTIVGQDLGLGTANVPGDATVQQVTYTRDPANATVTAARIEAIVNDPGTVVISGLPSGTTFVAHTGSGDVVVDITGNGVTFRDITNSVVRVAYDTGQCNGQGIWTIGLDGTTHIPTPNPVTLYHELSHAWHNLQGTVAANGPAEEQAAETDENDMRDQLGLPRRLTTDHTGGCGIPGSTSCLVVTAAYRSAVQVGPVAPARWLHSVRSALLPRYGLGGELFAQAYADYLDFSAWVATAMDRDVELREGVRDLLVEPLMRVYATAAARWLTPSVTSHSSGQLWRPLPAELRADPEPAASGEVAAALARRLRCAADGIGATPVANDPPPVVRIAGVVEAAGERPITRWALVEPLALYWEIAADDRPFPAALAAAITEGCPGWLGRAPVLYRNAPPSGEAVTHDLLAIRVRVSLSDAEALAVARRLVALWGPRVGFDLEAAIADAGFPCPDESRREASDA